MEAKIIFFEQEEPLRIGIKECQKKGHIQQVAFSTYHHCLTQICFTCKTISTNIQQKEL